MHIDITLKPNAWIAPEKFLQQINAAGYQGRKEDVRLTLTGRISRDGERLLFTADDLKPEPQTFLLNKSESKKPEEAKAFAEVFAKVNEYVGRRVELEAFWRPAPAKRESKSLATLLARRVAPLPQEAGKGD